jgi:hypothetical protein
LALISSNLPVRQGANIAGIIILQYIRLMFLADITEKLVVVAWRLINKLRRMFPPTTRNTASLTRDKAYSEAVALFSALSGLSDLNAIAKTRQFR